VIHLNLIEQLALTARLFGAEQVALAGMPAHNFTGGRDFKALGCAAMRLQLHFLILLHNFPFIFVKACIDSVIRRVCDGWRAAKNPKL
jgi:hypothetical protein